MDHRDAASAFKAALDGFDSGVTGDTIDVASFGTGTTVKFTQPKAGETVATLKNGGATSAIALFGQYSLAGFSATTGSSGTLIT